MSVRKFFSVISILCLSVALWADSEPWDENDPFLFVPEDTSEEVEQATTLAQVDETTATPADTTVAGATIEELTPITTEETTLIETAPTAVEKTPSTTVAQAPITPATVPSAMVLSVNTEKSFWDNEDADFFDESLQVFSEDANTPEEVNALSAASDRSVAFSLDEPTDFSTAQTPNQPHPSRISLRGNATPPTNTLRLYEGQFHLRRGIMNPNTGYKYMLTTPNGKRIAYLDMGDVLFNGPVDKYFKRKVIIQGVAERDAKTSALVIKAKAVRLKES